MRAAASGLARATVFLALARLAGFLPLAALGAGLLADIQSLLEGVALWKNARLYRPTSRCTGCPYARSPQPAKVTPKAFGNAATVRRNRFEAISAHGSGQGHPRRPPPNRLFALRR